MPRPPPRPLHLPDLVTNPQARAEYIQSHPPIHSPDPSLYFNTPPSPSSMTDVTSHRASGATFASSSSPATPASTRTSLSVHNAPWISDLSKRLSGSTGGVTLAPRGVEEGKMAVNIGNKKPRVSWSSALASTKSWFGGSSAAEAKGVPLTAENRSSRKEIKLSPSMIAAHMEASTPPCRPLSSPFPSTVNSPVLSPTGSTISTLSSSRTPRVGSGLRYYTERNPAPAHTRVQIREPTDPEDRGPSQPTVPPNNHDLIPAGPAHTQETLPSCGTIDVADEGMSGEVQEHSLASLKPSSKPSMDMQNSDVPDIRVSSGEDL